MYNAEAIATQLQIVGGLTCSTLAEIICRLAVYCLSARPRCKLTRCPRITIRDRHFRQRQPVKDGSPIITDIAQDHAFADVEVDDKLPLLPFDNLAISNLE